MVGQNRSWAVIKTNMTLSKWNCTVNNFPSTKKKKVDAPTTLLKFLFRGASLFILCCFSLAIDLETYDTSHRNYLFRERLVTSLDQSQVYSKWIRSESRSLLSAVAVLLHFRRHWAGLHPYKAMQQFNPGATLQCLD